LSRMSDSLAIAIWTETQHIVRQCQWTLKDLRAMSNSESISFKEAIDEGIKPAVARSFRDYLYKFEDWVEHEGRWHCRE
jgi:hypothetical protein